MSFTILSNKESATPGRPLLLIQITAVDGDTVFLCTTPPQGGSTLTYAGNTYQAVVQDQAIDAIQAMSPQGYDIPGNLSIKIADGGLAIWTNHANAHGWRGGTMLVTYIHWDIPTNTYSTDAFRWDFITAKPNIKADGYITVEATARVSMARLKVPNVARQKRCPWVFPQTPSQRAAGLNDPTAIYFQCGYSPDQPGGVGNLNSGSPFTSCDYTRASCITRGMFSTDSSARQTGRFGGDTWQAPTQYSGVQYTSGQKVYGFNQSTFGPGQYYPLVYGTQWVNCVVLEPAAEPNSLRAEVIVCVACDGPVNIQKLLVNGVEIPQGGGDVLFTWRYINQGGRNGSINQDAIFNGNGDPHGSLCCVEFVVPVQLAAGGSVPKVQALVQGPPVLQAYPISSAVGSGGNIVITFPGTNVDCAGNPPFKVGIAGNGFVADGFYTLTNWGSTSITLSQTGTGSASGGYVYFYAYTTNPVWHLMDLLTWGPWKIASFDVPTWFAAAAVCDQPVTYTDMNGNASATHARYRSSFALEGGNRQVLAAAVTALRANAGIILARNPTSGLLQCFIEQTLADQQPTPIAGSNYNTAVASITAGNVAANGYLAYLFDGAGSIEKGTFSIGGRSINDTPNRVVFAFQDEDNQWQQDSISTIDPDGYVYSGNQEIDVPLQILGVPNFDQGTRRSNVELSKALRGNARGDAGGTEIIEFTTTVKAAHLASRVGYICGITYQQLGL